MNFKDEIDFLTKLGLNITAFGKALHKSYKGSKDISRFIVVRQGRQEGRDELCYQGSLPEQDMNRLRNWIRCGDLTGLLPEWREVDVGFKVKAYLAGENLGIDCTNVMDEMFANEGDENYTYALSKRNKARVIRTTHPQEYLSLSGHYGKPWRAAKDFSDLITLNRGYLLGQVAQTSYDNGILEETTPLIQGLLKLHDIGLLTICSQPYCHEVYELSDRWLEEQQIPFVTFIMPGKDSPYLEFFNKLKERDDIVVSAEVLCPLRIIDGSHDRHDVTRARTADRREDLQTVEWKMSLDVCSGEEIDLHNFGGIELANPISFDVAAREWGVPLDLLSIIEEVADSCGLS